MRIKRRKRYLAEVIGNYSLKARSFARIKLFIYNAERVNRVVGTFDRKGRLQKLGGYHLREYRRKSWLKKYYHRCVHVYNLCCVCICVVLGSCDFVGATSTTKTPLIVAPLK